MEGSISEPDVLSKRSKFVYSVGLVLNDVTSSMWFSYTLVFYNRVLKFPNAFSGYLLLIEQISNASLTLFVALICDRTRTGLFHYGKRKTWHLIGVICVLISFPFLFNLCIGCQNSKFWVQFVYYMVFIIIFQFGRACSQVTHLAMINELTHEDDERIALNSYRLAWAFFSNLYVYTMASILLGFSATSNELSITSADAPIFRKLTFIVVGFGLICMSIFHVGLKESNPTDQGKEYYTELTSESGIGGSTVIVCCVALASDLIGFNTECGAFIYGVMAFIDKVATGIIIAIVQQTNPCKLTSTNTCGSYYRYIITLIPGDFSIFATLIVLSMWKANIGGNRYEVIQERQSEMDMEVKRDCNEQSPLVD
ncbi:unnamed protein product [Rotaria sp. Silwood1]|nr:unnamed protein product [Rotaria sp. Silwood1]